MTDKPDANEIIPRIDHKAFLLKDVLKKPKLSFWDLYKLKKHLETGYEKLNEKKQQEETKYLNSVSDSTSEIQSDPDNTGEDLDSGSRDDRESVEQNPS